MAASVVTLGFKEFAVKAEAMGDELLDELDLEVEDAAKNWEGLAKDSAPVDHGLLVGLISHTPVVDHSADVTSGAFYSPYQEWGTGSRAVIPLELQSYAAQFWTHKIHLGIFPQPYFFIQHPIVEQEFLDNLKTLLSTEH